MLADVRQATIRPVIEATVAEGALVHTDEYGVYARLEAWGYRHKTHTRSGWWCPARTVPVRSSKRLPQTLQR